MKRSDCRVSYDADAGRLVYQGSDADERHWDEQWASLLASEAVRKADPFVVAETKRHLQPGARVLDAGCGLSHTVWGLHQAGFDAYGVDYAAETVRTVNRLAPELQVAEADVRSLPFADGYFDAVWSLGVIEHFPEGFRPIIDEMSRVLKPSGIAFVTVPSMSPLRAMKARLGAYPAHRGDMSEFYQFILRPETIIAEFKAAGWIYDGGQARGGFKGLKDESGPLMPLLQRIYDTPSKPAHYLRAGLNRALAPVSYHTRLYRFRKAS